MVPKLCSALPMIHHWWHSRRPQVRARSLFSSFTPPTRPRELSATTATATTTSASCVRPIKTTWSMAIIVWVGLCRFRFVALMFRLGNFVFICAANNKNVIKDAMQSAISIVQGMRITRGGISISCSCFFNSICYLCTYLLQSISMSFNKQSYFDYRLVSLNWYSQYSPCESFCRCLNVGINSSPSDLNTPCPKNDKAPSVLTLTLIQMSAGAYQTRIRI